MLRSWRRLPLPKLHGCASSQLPQKQLLRVTLPALRGALKMLTARLASVGHRIRMMLKLAQAQVRAQVMAKATARLQEGAGAGAEVGGVAVVALGLVTVLRGA